MRTQLWPHAVGQPVNSRGIAGRKTPRITACPFLDQSWGGIKPGIIPQIDSFTIQPNSAIEQRLHEYLPLAWKRPKRACFRRVGRCVVEGVHQVADPSSIPHCCVQMTEVRANPVEPPSSTVTRRPRWYRFRSARDSLRHRKTSLAWTCFAETETEYDWLFLHTHRENPLWPSPVPPSYR